MRLACLYSRRSDVSMGKLEGQAWLDYQGLEPSEGIPTHPSDGCHLLSAGTSAELLADTWLL